MRTFIKQILGNRTLFVVLYIALYAGAFFVNEGLSNAFLAQGISIHVFLGLLTLLCGWFFQKQFFNASVKMYYRPAYVLLISIVSLWVAFSLVGYPLFMSGSLPQVEPKGVLCFALVFLWTIPVSYSFLMMLEKVSTRFSMQNAAIAKTGRVNNIFTVLSSRRVQRQLLFFSISFVPLFLISLCYYPASMTHDSAVMWLCVTGGDTIKDTHSATLQLIMRLCSSIYNSPYSVVLLQVVCYSILLSFISNFLFSKGYPLKIIIMLTFLSSFLPCTYKMLVYVKDSLFAISVLWVMYLLARQWDAPKKFYENPLNILAFSISSASVFLFRRNGFVIFPAIIISTLCLIWRIRILRIGLKSVFSILCAVLIVCTVKGPIFTLNKVGSGMDVGTSAQGFTAGPLMALYANDVPISEDILETMDQILPLNEWKYRYSRFDIDPFFFGDPRPDYSILTTSDEIVLYLRLLREYPLVLIKTRLDGINFLWNLIKPSNYRLSLPPAEMRLGGGWVLGRLPDLERPEWAHEGNVFYIEREGIAKLPESLASLSRRNPVVNSIFWMNGLYVNIVLLILVFAIARRKEGVVYQFITLLLISVPYALIVHFQLYQYGWFFPISVVFMFFYTPVAKSWERNGESTRSP